MIDIGLEDNVAQENCYREDGDTDNFQVSCYNEDISDSNTSSKSHS